MTSDRSLFDLLTAAIILVLSVYGMWRRAHRLVRLKRITLVEPIHPDDVAYLHSVIWSTYLRLGVKIVIFIGSLIMLFGLPLFEIWRIGLILMLIFMNIETVSVDHIRDRLARPRPATTTKRDADSDS